MPLTHFGPGNGSPTGTNVVLVLVLVVVLLLSEFQCIKTFHFAIDRN